MNYTNIKDAMFDQPYLYYFRKKKLNQQVETNPSYINIWVFLWSSLFLLIFLPHCSISHYYYCFLSCVKQGQLWNFRQMFQFQQCWCLEIRSWTLATTTTTWEQRLGAITHHMVKILREANQLVDLATERFHLTL